MMRCEALPTGRWLWKRVVGVAALAVAIGCNSGQSVDAAPGLTLTSSIRDTTVAQGTRLNVPFVLTWRNQPADSVSITLDNRPTNMTVDVNASTGTVVGDTDTGVLTVVVGVLDPGAYAVDLVARGAGNSLASIPFTINVTLIP
jgi:hypothetical protein